MKKFFAMAIMALAVVFASCSGAGGSERYKGGKTPTIDNDKHTVNGIVYDNETAKCWKVTTTVVVSFMGASDTETTTEYLWMTEFLLVSTMEESMALVADVPYSKSNYSYIEVPAADSEACYANRD